MGAAGVEQQPHVCHQLKTAVPKMSYNYRLSEEAESDIYNPYLWYGNQKEGLGKNF